MKWYEWIFSGMGSALAIALGGALCRIMWNYFSKPKPMPPSTTALVSEPPTGITVNPPPIGIIPEPNPLEIPAIPPGFENDVTAVQIAEALTDAAPLAIEHIGEQFRGMRINWTVNFSSASKTIHDDMVLVHLKTNNVVLGDWNRVVCEVKLEEYPFLRALKKPAQIQIRGKVGKIGLMIDTIPIEDASLQLLR
jgi:hypothetical protein